MMCKHTPVFCCKTDKFVLISCSCYLFFRRQMHKIARDKPDSPQSPPSLSFIILQNQQNIQVLYDKKKKKKFSMLRPIKKQGVDSQHPAQLFAQNIRYRIYIFCKACSISAIISSICSIPTDRRTKSGVTPTSTCSSADSC